MRHCCAHPMVLIRKSNSQMVLKEAQRVVSSKCELEVHILRKEVKQMAQVKVYLELPSFTGRNVPIIVSTFDHIKVTIPDESLIMSFDRLVSPILDETYTLLKQNRNLIRQRDLLLPRLMSGKLEV